MKNLLYTILSTSFILINCNQLIAQDFSGTHFRNGDIIPYVESKEEWVKAGENKQPAWCYYLNDPANGAAYGKLYNWYAVSDPRGLCPVGWHVPSESEWKILSGYLGGTETAGQKMKSANGWREDGNGDNSSGFNGLPGASRFGDGQFSFKNGTAQWWSASVYDMTAAKSRRLFHSNDNLSGDYNHNKSGLSIRCLKD